MVEIRDGDVFRWSYRDRPNATYWCNSRIAIAWNRYLRDTFWHGSDSDGTYFTYAQATEILHLTLLGNLDDFEKRPVNTAYYDPADIMNLNHSNSSSGNIYVRKGAEQSRTAMLAEAERMIAEAKDRIRSATCDLERLREAHAKLTAGEMVRWL